MHVLRVAGAVLLAMVAAAPAAADEVIDGHFGPGARYRLVRPGSWNGDLVLYAHGFVPSDADVALPPEGELLISLLAPRGFAVAFSSFSETGWDVKDGAQRTQQLLGLFTSKFGQPSRIYVGGASMGGLIAIELVERHPFTFAAAIASCAVAGGARREFDYVGHVRVLFDFFYPGVLPGSVIEVDPHVDVTQAIVSPSLVAMQSDPTGALAIGLIEQTPIPYASAAELVESIATALAWHAMIFGDVLVRTRGHLPFDNRNTVYTGAVPPSLLAGINAGVKRVDSSPSALAYLDRNYEPIGDLRIPTLLLSTSRDPVVPGFNQAAYRAAVAAAGNPDLLVERVVDRYGHCVFTPAELAAAFADVAAWVEFGIKPQP